ncbi:hypothetical protein HYS50_03380 [Candidatus Woesearchaeota archaeon]|nr:hypothetical protein [Candidatus Woesearchaeota archaeon]
MTKIYLVSSGSYSDYGILAAFSTEEKAKKLLTILEKTSNECGIEEYDLDPEVGNFTQYFVFMKKDGSLLNEIYHTRVYFPEAPRVWFTVNSDYPEGFMNYVAIAKSEQQAIKAANEHRTQAIAMETWGK